MKTIRCFAAVTAALAAAVLVPTPIQSSAGNCFARAADVTEFAACESGAPDAAPVATVTPCRAFELKGVHG